jgi:hypothetical protein
MHTANMTLRSRLCGGREGMIGDPEEESDVAISASS